MRAIHFSEVLHVHAGCRDVISETALRWSLGLSSFGAGAGTLVAYLEPFMNASLIGTTTIYMPSLWFIVGGAMVGAACGVIAGAGIACFINAITD